MVTKCSSKKERKKKKAKENGTSSLQCVLVNPTLAILGMMTVPQQTLNSSQASVQPKTPGIDKQSFLNT